jgi:putative nucleotidyltransferase with HDIG domain
MDHSPIIELFEKDLPKGWTKDESSKRLYKHSLMTAQAAEASACKIPGLDTEKAYSFGLFHDIGKFSLPTEKKYKHPRIGYNFMKDKVPDIAEICISHPFPLFGSIRYLQYYCNGDFSEAMAIFSILLKINEDDIYIKLIQFCDKVSKASGYTTLQTRFDEYAKNITNKAIYRKTIQPNCERLLETKKMLDKLTAVDVDSLISTLDVPGT